MSPQHIYKILKIKNNKSEGLYNVVKKIKFDTKFLTHTYSLHFSVSYQILLKEH